MVSSDLLHQLIHSLSKTEKKYFKETSSGQNYVKLFDAINEQKEYDEEKLRKKFKGETFINNFSAAKSYLQEALLRSLRNFNAGKLMDDVSYERLQNIKLLYEKGFVTVAEKQLAKLKQFCYTYELYTRLLEVFSFEMQLNNGLNRSNEKLYAERKRILKVLGNINELNQVYGEMIAIATRTGYHSKAQTDMVEQLMQNPLLNENAICGEPDEKYALWNVFFVYHYISKNFSEAYKAKMKQFELYRDGDVIIKTRPKTYLLMLGNLVSLAYNIPSLHDFEYSYEQMLKAHEAVKGFESLKFEQRSAFGLLLFRLKRDYRHLDAHVQYISENLEKHAGNISLVRETDTYFNVALAFFRKKDYNKTIDWLQKIIDHPRPDERLQIQRIARHMLLLVHYELKNFELLDYMITNTQRYLAKRNLSDEFDKVLLNGFKALIKAAGKPALKKALQKLKAEMQGIKKNEAAPKNEAEFEYLAWIEDKLNTV
ncbi:MAG: hypothetical protein KA149_01290 [Chitinophagales bacterium]|nr:hypothetical protein [Chitinophagales bacterium]